MSGLDPQIAIAVVDDDPAVREVLGEFIAAAPDMLCAGVFPTGEAFLRALPDLPVQIVLMDIQLPGMSGIDCIRRIKELQPAIQVLMLTVFEDHDRIFRSLAAGATGYLLKQTPPDRLLESIRELHRGGTPLSAQVARRVVETFQQPAPAPAPAGLSVLSPREQQILALLAQGRLYKEIAATLSLSLDTVRTHLRNIYAKLEVRSRTEAVMKVYGRRPPEP
ncbi:MAG: response regulator transcription factor [Verrucomicrobiae bacterium]|nr:response regulator transcription factor [Verrucomicrobiae bacterium]